MRTLVIGCNHRSAPVEVRERIAFDPAAVDRALRELTIRFPCSEGVLISTCNRMELYVSRPVHGHPRIDEVIQFIADFHGISAADITASFFHHEDVEAVRHLFRMVSSLDSMVLGVSQILAQARQAYELARSVGTVGKRLDALFQHAFAAAKEIHAKTAIATGRLSVGSTAVDLARQIFSNFADKTVMMVGAGKMGELTLTHLLEMRPMQLLVTNRTDQRATELAQRINQRHGVQAVAVPFAEWIERLADTDIVISSTGAREPILSANQYTTVHARRAFRPLLFIDIAVPRDIDASMEKFNGVYLYNIDDLQSVVEANLANRRDAIGRCHEIIESHVVEFVESQSRNDIGPTVEALKQRFQEIGQQEFDWLIRKLDSVSPHDRELIEQMLHRVTQKLLHGPVSLLSDHSANGATRVYAETLRAMFQLADQD